jgi:hypothetical protein
MWRIEAWLKIKETAEERAAPKDCVYFPRA